MSSWADDGEEPEREFEDVDAFVAGFLAPTWRRSLETGGRVWCPRWRQHPEAVSRLSGLWLAYEALAHDKHTGLADWWLRYADPTMTVLLDADGPFKACRHGHTARLEPLPLDDAGARSTS